MVGKIDIVGERGKNGYLVKVKLNIHLKDNHGRPRKNAQGRAWPVDCL